MTSGGDFALGMSMAEIAPRLLLEYCQILLVPQMPMK